MAEKLKSDTTVQMNIRIRRSTKDALDKLAEAELRSLGDQVDYMVCEALAARKAKAK